MRFATARRSKRQMAGLKHWVARAVLAVLPVIAGGCTSPPSVSMLLRVTEKAMLDEAARLDDDATRNAAQATQSRQSLASAFDADLAQVQTLNAQWVKDAAEGYAAAREALVRNELQTQTEWSQRASNLRTAAQAQDRALQLLEQQDTLVLQVTGLNFWRLTFNKPTDSITPKEKP